MKSNSVMSVTETDDGLRFEFKDLAPLTLCPANLAEAVRARGLIHGLKQKCVDAAAIARDPTTGRSATVEDKRNAVARVIDMLSRGLWTERKAAERRSDDNALLVDALAEVLGKPRDAIIDKVRSYTKAQLNALRISERVKPVLERLEREAGGGLDSDALLDEMFEEADGASGEFPEETAEESDNMPTWMQEK